MTQKHILGLTVCLLAGMATAQFKNMNLIISAENATKCGHDYSKASAWLWRWERGNGTGVLFRIRNAKPNHLHTIWIKLAKPSPLSGAGATPAAATWAIRNIIKHADTTSAVAANAFYTNHCGNAWVWIPLNFRLSNGVYPFSKYKASADNVAISNTPFTFRVISHCTDNKQHGLKPGVHESTFQVSL